MMAGGDEQREALEHALVDDAAACAGPVCRWEGANGVVAGRRRGAAEERAVERAVERGEEAIEVRAVVFASCGPGHGAGAELDRVRCCESLGFGVVSRATWSAGLVTAPAICGEIPLNMG